MTEIYKFPGELRQLTNYLSSRKDISKANIREPVLRFALAGFATMVPEEIRRAGILESPETLLATDKLITFQIALNDRIDFSLSGRNDIGNLIETSQKKERHARSELDAACASLNDSEKPHRLQSCIDILIAETEYIESDIRKQSRRVTFDDAMQYRRLVNAIAACTVTSFLFGEEYLADRLTPIRPEETSWDSLIKKYTWLLENKPGNPIEVALVVMDKITTVGQIDDDWYGRHIDALLRIPSPALIALKYAKGNENEVRALLNEQRDENIGQARKLGLGILPSHGFTRFFRYWQMTARSMTQFGRITGIKIKPMARERAYMNGEL